MQSLEKQSFPPTFPRLSRRAVLSGLGAGSAGLPFMSHRAVAQMQVPRLDVPYVPTPQDVVDRMLDMAQVSATDFVMDLGCGDGRMLVTAAKKFGARGFGVDINPERIKEATENARTNGVSANVTFEVKNLFETPIAQASVLTMYLLPDINLQLRPRILREMKPGSRIVSHAFTMGDWEPDLQDQVRVRDIYFWIVPAQVAGKWTLSEGGDTYALDLVQKYQKFEGTVTINGAPAKLTHGRLAGEDISFVVEAENARRRAFIGKVTGDAMKFDPLTMPDIAKDWAASRGK
jgi:SAM-dependent methyltransferase